MSEAFGDPLHLPFWDAARRRELVMQRCRACAQYQFFARSFCLACGREDLGWERVSGRGVVYAMTTVHRTMAAEFPAPYTNALVQLDEGPRLVTTLVGPPCRIGDAVRVAWREREGAPPLPVFEKLQGRGN